MRVDEAVGASKPLDVTFPSGAVLHIVYRPANYSIAEMERASAERNDPSRLVKMVQELIEAWDLTYVEKMAGDNGETYEVERPVDIANVDHVRHHVTSPIISAVVRAIREDQDPGEA